MWRPSSGWFPTTSRGSIGRSLASKRSVRPRCAPCSTTAVERSSWHRRRLEGLDIASLSDRAIVDLPVMTKTDLMDNFDSVVTDTRLSRRLCEDHLDRNPGDHLLGEFQVVASGGSSGQRGVYVYGWDAWAICYASNVRFQARDWSRDPTLAGIPRVTGVVAASSPTHISAALSKTFSSGRQRPASLPRQPAARDDRGRAERAATDRAHGLQLVSPSPRPGSPERAAAHHAATVSSRSPNRSCPRPGR